MSSLTMRSRTLLGASAAALMSLGFGAEAAAQVVDTITVTAQRREADLQSVPASVTAIQPETLEQRQIANVLDLQYQAPNLSLATNTGTASGARIFLRGIGEDESRVSADPAVGVYVDGVYVGRQVGALFDLVDLERVEVLRGPQGTLYGRNSNGGAVRLVSRAPAGDNSGDLQATVGSESRFDLRGVGDIALGQSTALRVSALYRSRDGFHTLTPNGDFTGQGGNVGAVETIAWRASLRHEFNEDWTATLAVDQTLDDSDPVPDSADPANDADGDLFTIEPLPGTTCSTLTPGTFQPIGCFTGYSSEVDAFGTALTLTGEVGAFTFQSLTGYRTMEDDLVSRIGFPYFQQTDQDQLSQEFTLTSNFDGPTNFVAGVFFYNEDVSLDSTFVLDFAIGVETQAAAIFGQVTHDLTETVTLTAGARFTDETKDFDGANVTVGAPLTRSESADFENFTYNLSVQNQFSDNVMGYLSYSTGFKSGGWSPDCFSAAACFQPVEEETVETFEAGLRSTLLDGAMRFNATYFFNTYEGLQIGATVPGLGFTRFNVDETQIQGLEFEANWALTESLDLFAVLGFLDSEYTSVTLAQAGGLTNSGAACPGGTVTIACALGLDLKNAPQHKGTIGFLHTSAFADGELTIGGDVSFEDESWSLVANGPPHALTNPDPLLNARIAYQPNDKPWRVALWGRNLTDQEYGRAATANQFSVFASPPLEWGVDLGVSF
ncbi:MAG: TonB-dependent receptor [Pseudomonadota bacterium]